MAGAGLMGHGIAQVLAAAGRSVDLYEPELALELRRRQGRHGLATLCLGGGGSVAMAFERV